MIDYFESFEWNNKEDVGLERPRGLIPERCPSDIRWATYARLLLKMTWNQEWCSQEIWGRQKVRVGELTREITDPPFGLSFQVIAETTK